MNNFRDIENLSAYLDGQLSPTDAARLETRLKSDPELAAILSDLRAARGILRKLPARKAPRNFTLTRQMVGLKPPMPRTYPLFRLATVFATMLFVFSFTATALSPMFNLVTPNTGAALFGMGGGCDGDCGEPAMESAPMEEAAPFAADVAPAEATEDGARIQTEAEPAPKEGGEFVGGTGSGGPGVEDPNQAQVQDEAPVSYTLPLIFLVVSLLGAAAMWVMRQNAKRKWQ